MFKLKRKNFILKFKNIINKKSKLIKIKNKFNIINNKLNNFLSDINFNSCNAINSEFPLISITIDNDYKFKIINIDNNYISNQWFSYLEILKESFQLTFTNND